MPLDIEKSVNNMYLYCIHIFSLQCMYIICRYILNIGMSLKSFQNLIQRYTYTIKNKNIMSQKQFVKRICFLASTELFFNYFYQVFLFRQEKEL